MNKLRVGVIILARYSSSRLPGKALSLLNGKIALDYTIERVKQVFPISSIFIATSEHASDDVIYEFAMTRDIGCFRGSLTNVAERFYSCAAVNELDYAFRINGDNIFVDIKILAEFKALAERNVFDFISNVKGHTFPAGMSIEVMRISYYLYHLDSILKNSIYSEHVTSYFYEQDLTGSFYFLINSDLPEAQKMHLALDTSVDFILLSAISKSMKTDHCMYNLNEIFELFKTIVYEK